MTMVERVARALCRANRYGGEHPTADDFRAARAAIKAMREPTPGMIDAIDEFVIDPKVMHTMTHHAWPAAIDAALQELTA